VRQLGAIRRGERKPLRSTTFEPTDVKAVRADLGQSQAEFAMMIGVSVATLRNWEQGAVRPMVRHSHCYRWRRTIRQPSSRHCIGRAGAVLHNDACCRRRWKRKPALYRFKVLPRSF